MSGLPAGFVERDRGPATLIGREDLFDALVAAGLDESATWVGLLPPPSEGAGRGGTAVLELALPRGGSLKVRLKQMRRGGMIGPLWRERFPGRERLIDNLRVPLAAAERDVATAAPVALLTVQGPPGLYRAWMAFEEIESAADLLARFRSDAPPTEAELRAVMAVVRAMHDRGIEHVDLNLGNLLVRPGSAGAEAFVIDLDRGRVRGSGGVEEGRRLAALRRLERSFRKNFPDREPPLWCYRLYAEDDPDRVERMLADRSGS